MEIDHDTVRSMSDAELADRYDAVTGQISDLYTARRPLEAEIRARMDDQGTVRLKGEESEVKLSSPKATSWRFEKDGSYSYTTGIAHERYNRPY